MKRILVIAISILLIAFLIVILIKKDRTKSNSYTTQTELTEETGSTSDASSSNQSDENVDVVTSDTLACAKESTYEYANECDSSSLPLEETKPISNNKNSRCREEISKSTVSSTIDERKRFLITSSRYLVHDIPVKMQYEKGITISAYIISKQQDTLLKKIPEIRGNSLYSINTTDIVKVLLKDPSSSFKIEEYSTEEQGLSDSTYTVWKWRVTPIKYGSHPLALLVTTKIVNSFATYYTDTPVFEQYINIEITNKDKMFKFINEHFEFVIGTIMIPLLIFVFNYFKKKYFANKKSK